MWDGGAQAEVTTLQVIVLSRIEWLLVSVREAFFFFFNSPSLPFPSGTGYSPQIPHKNDKETLVLLGFYQRARNSLFFIHIGQFLAT